LSLFIRFTPLLADPTAEVPSTAFPIVVLRNDTLPVGAARPGRVTMPSTVAAIAYCPAFPVTVSVVVVFAFAAGLVIVTVTAAELLAAYAGDPPGVPANTAL
jgi:hypothetical protein